MCICIGFYFIFGSVANRFPLADMYLHYARTARPLAMLWLGGAAETHNAPLAALGGLDNVCATLRVDGVLAAAGAFQVSAQLSTTLCCLARSRLSLSRALTLLWRRRSICATRRRCW